MINYYHLEVMENFDLDIEDELEYALFLDEQAITTGYMVEGPSQYESCVVK
jgi:hypothetical protein